VDAKTDVSREVVSAHSIERLRDDLKGLSKDVARLRLSNNSAADTIATSFEEVSPAADVSPEIISGFVASNRRNALIHNIDTKYPGWSLCDWPYVSSASVRKFTSLEECPLEELKRCPQCIKREALPQFNDSASESSDSNQ